MKEWIYIGDLIGTAVFALCGILAASKYRMDPFGAIVLAAVTAVGGGTIRDALLGATPVFWMKDPNYLVAILLTIAITPIFIRKPVKAPWWLLPVADALGLALFTVIGAEKALAFGLSSMIAVVMGLITGVGGGIIRDLLCRQVPMVLRTEIYATASILGGVSYTIAIAIGLNGISAIILAMISTLALRLSAIKWRLSLPTVNLAKKRV